MVSGRALHFVFKIGDRQATYHFYREILGMKVLRHEEFTEGCEAQCNGPYANRWSKTMMGYGPEDTHFAVELTYNYGVKDYQRGNDFLGMTIQSSQAIARAKAANLKVSPEGDSFVITAPGGYIVLLIDKEQPTDCDPVKRVNLASSKVSRAVHYWSNYIGLKTLESHKDNATMAFNKNQVLLHFYEIDAPVTHNNAYGRIAFAIPTNELAKVQKKCEKGKTQILKPLVSLDTPGKATVSVVILADPDGHEICLVGEEGFRQLSQVDPHAEELLKKSIANDKS